MSGAGGGSRPRKYGIMRLHAGAREQRRAVVGARDERRGGNPHVALRLEEREISLAQLCARPHASIVPDASGLSAAATSSARSCSRWAAASRAVAIASSIFRLDTNDETPPRKPAISPASFVTGYVTAPETVRTAVSAACTAASALSVATSTLSSSRFTRSSVSPPLWITGSSSASVCSIVFVV